MRRVMFRFAIALLTFAFGVVSGALWYSHRNHASPHPVQQAKSESVSKSDEKEWELTEVLVKRALQTRIIYTSRLKRNSDDEVVWRWLKQVIAEYQATPGYERKSLVLSLSEPHTYFIVISTLSSDEIKSADQYNRKEGLPLLKADGHYGRLQLNIDDVTCPSWTGLIDLEQPKLMSFVGMGA